MSEHMTGEWTVGLLRAVAGRMEGSVDGLNRSSPPVGREDRSARGGGRRCDTDWRMLCRRLRRRRTPVLVEYRKLVELMRMLEAAKQVKTLRV